jgi:uncharacterized protein with HEPN domain
MSRRSDLRLLDIIEAIDNIAVYTHGMSFEAFLNDNKTKDAVVRNIEIIGEAARALEPAIKRKHASIPWNDIIGMRNIIVHVYFGVLPKVIWDIVTTELPKLKIQAQTIYDDLKS